MKYYLNTEVDPISKDNPYIRKTLDSSSIDPLSFAGSGFGHGLRSSLKLLACGLTLSAGLFAGLKIYAGNLAQEADLRKERENMLLDGSASRLLQSTQSSIVREYEAIEQMKYDLSSQTDTKVRASMNAEIDKREMVLKKRIRAYKKTQISFASVNNTGEELPPYDPLIEVKKRMDSTPGMELKQQFP